MNIHSKIYIAGHTGLVGSAILKRLKELGYDNLVTRTHKELDLTDQALTACFFAEERPEYVFLAAAKVGGIGANNQFRGDFIGQNLQIQTNVIHQSYVSGVKKLLFLGSTCIYPRETPQPIKEEYLLTGPLEYTNEPYAVAKIAGLKLCESYNMQYGTNFIAVMPTSLYGPGDNFNLATGHVLPVLLRRIYLGKCLENGDLNALREDFARRPVDGVDGSDPEAVLKTLDRFGIRKDAQIGQIEIAVWGSGTPLREFLWSEDMADACVFLMNRVDWTDLAAGMKEPRNCHINLGSGHEISIRDLAHLIAEKWQFTGRIAFDPSKPDGTMRKLIDSSKLNRLGWHHRIELEEGIEKLIDWYSR